MLTNDTRGSIYWLGIALLCLIRGALIIPNVDDGIYFYQIYNTIGWHNPFYNDYYGQYFHFMKTLTVLYALVYSLAGNTSYRLIALLQSGELFACVAVLYACARRYASESASRAGALIFLYFLFVQEYLSPTRPETTVLLCALLVFWLCERFADTSNVRYLCWAAALTFLIALPMHTNGSIPFMYLTLFTMTQRRKLSRGPAIPLALCSLLCGLAGAALLLYPNLSSFARSLALFSFDGSRFSMIKGEYTRLRQFIGGYYNFPMIVFIASFAAVLLITGQRMIKLTDLKAYRSIFLFLFAVVLGLGVLPSATWEVYVVYYFLPLTLGLAVALDRYAYLIDHPYRGRLLLAGVGLVTLWHGYGVMQRLYLLLYALPFFLAALVLGRVTMKQSIAIMVIPMFGFSMVGMGASRIIYDRANRVIHDAEGAVLAHPLFNFCGRNVVQVGTYQISGGSGVYTIALASVEGTKADLINAHPLVKWFSKDRVDQPRSAWVFRRELEKKFLLISNNQWKVPALIEGQVKPLGYSVTGEFPLSSPMLDRYANASVKELKCREYNYRRPTT